MKKLSFILCVLMIACLAISACAEEIPSSNLYKPAVSDTFRTLVSGKTFEACVSRNECFGEDEDAFTRLRSLQAKKPVSKRRT